MKQQSVIRYRFLCLLTAGLLLGAQTQARTLVEEGEVSLSADEFRQVLERALPESEQEALRVDPARFNNLVMDYFMLKQLSLEGRAAGLDDAAFQARMELYRMRSLANQVLRNKLDAMPEPNFEAAARESYQLNKASFKAPPRVHAEHILIAINDERDDAQALARAQEVRARLVRQPDSFKALAKEFSDDPSAANNQGDLGYFAAQQMVEPFAKAAFSLKKGEISQPVLSQFGYHIIRTLDHRDSGYLPFEEVREQLVDRQKKDFKARQREQLVRDLQGRDSVQYHREAIDALQAEFAAQKK